MSQSSDSEVDGDDVKLKSLSRDDIGSDDFGAASSSYDESVIEDDENEYEIEEEVIDEDLEEFLYEEETLSDDEGWDEDLLRQYWERYHKATDIFGDESVLFDTELMQKLIQEREAKEADESTTQGPKVILNTKAILALGKFMKIKNRVSERVIVRQVDGTLKVKRKTKTSKSKSKQKDGKKSKSKEAEDASDETKTKKTKAKKKNTSKKSIVSEDLESGDKLKKVKKPKSKPRASKVIDDSGD